jgi:PKD repeat protein
MLFCCYNITATTPLEVSIQSPANVGQGEEFTIYVQLTNNQIAAWDWKLNLSYSPSLVSVISAEIPDENPVMWNTGYDEVIIGVNYIKAQSMTTNPIIENCTLIKVVFRTISYGKLQLNFNMMKVEIPSGGVEMETINVFQNKTVIIEKVTPTPPPYIPPNISPNNIPIANPGGPYEAFVNESITFDGSLSNDSNGQIVSYDWDLGNGVTKNGKMIVYTYTKAGNYNVALTVTDNDGEKGKQRVYAIISERNETDTIIPVTPNDNDSDNVNIHDVPNNNQTDSSKENIVSDTFISIFIFIVGFVFLGFTFWYWRKK